MRCFENAHEQVHDGALLLGKEGQVTVGAQNNAHSWWKHFFLRVGLLDFETARVPLSATQQGCVPPVFYKEPAFLDERTEHTKSVWQIQIRLQESYILNIDYRFSCGCEYVLGVRQATPSDC